MQDRKRAQRALLRYVLRQQIHSGDDADSFLLPFQSVVDDESVFETCYELAMQEAKLFGESTGALEVAVAADGSLIVDNLLGLLQWFVGRGCSLVSVDQLQGANQ